MAWGFLTRFALSKTRQPLTASGWALVNLCTLIVAIPALLLVERLAPTAPQSWLPFAIMVASLVRSVVDYRLYWDFYFPRTSAVRPASDVAVTALADSNG